MKFIGEKSIQYTIDDVLVGIAGIQFEATDTIEDIMIANEKLGKPISKEEAEVIVKSMQTKDYALVVRIPFKAIDDIQARETAKALFRIEGVPNINIKLQEVFSNKAPRGVSL